MKRLPHQLIWFFLGCLVFGFLFQLPRSAISQPAVPDVDLPTHLSPRNIHYGEDSPQSLDALLDEAILSTAVAGSAEPTAEFTVDQDEADPERYQELVMQSYRDRTWEIYRVYSAFSPNPNVVRLTANSAYDGEPRYSRGCQRIVFTSNRDGNYDLYVMDANGGNVARLTQNSGNNRSAFWSPDGGWIAFSSDRDGNREIYVMAADGSAQQRLTDNGAADLHPTFSPDGRQIAWIRIVSDQHGAIMVANADGTGATQIGPSLRFLSDLVWSPDGGRLAFDYDADGDGWNELGVIDRSGAGLQVIKTGGAQVDILAGSWSTTGGHLFASVVHYIYYQGNYYIERIDTEKYNLQNGSNITIFAGQLDLYPDAQPNDISIPTSSVRALPGLSRASETAIDFTTWDPGPAEVRAIEIQYRYGTAGEWLPLANRMTANGEGSIAFTGTAGETAYFRSRAQDYADHWEQWPEGNGDTWTTFYTWQLSGSVHDARGLPLPGASLTVAPGSLDSISSDDSGKFTGHLVSTGSHSITSGHDGYGALSPAEIDVFRDTEFSVYLPDATNWLANGDFEDQVDPFSGWQISAFNSPTTTTGYTGANAAHLGPPCAPPCLGETEYLATFDTSLDMSRVVLRTDLLGNVHMLYDQRYTVRNTLGHWSTPVTLGNEISTKNLPSYTKPSLAVDAQGGVHAVTSGRYYYKPANGDWGDGYELKPGAGEETPDILRTDLASNAQGVTALAYNSYDGYWGRWSTHFVHRSAGGSWTYPVSWYGRPVAALTATPDGRFHLFQAGLEDLCQWIVPADGQVDSNMAPVWCAKVSATDIRVAPSQDGALHLVAYANQLIYLRRDPSGIWAGPYAITRRYGVSNPYQEHSLAVDATGAVHLAVASGDASTPVRYYFLAPGSVEFHMYEMPIGEYLAPESLDLVVDQFNHLHFAQVHHQYALSYRRSLHWTSSGRVELAAPLTIPAAAHNPTLTFMARTYGASPDKPSLTVTIHGGGETLSSTDVFTLTSSPQWRLGWIPLDAWLGKSVTVTFALAAIWGQPLEHVWLDALTAGEWWTPLITQVTPSHFVAGGGGLLTINGSNFPANPVVTLGGTTLENVALLDDVTIQATVPAAVPVGRYRVVVTTPQGQSGASPGTIEIGEHVFLPLIRE